MQVALMTLLPPVEKPPKLSDTVATVWQECQRCIQPFSWPGQPVVENPPLSTVALSRVGPHEIPPQRKRLVSNKHVGHRARILSTTERDIWGERKGLGIQGLPKGRRSQRPSIAAPTVCPDINDA